MSKLKIILISAFILRLFLAPLAEHDDIVSYHFWAKDLWENGLFGFYDRNMNSKLQPTYPPVSSYIFWGVAGGHEFFEPILTFLNIPSDKSWYFFIKLPAIFADTLIIYLLYQISKIFSKKWVLLPSIFFAYLPPFWYNSSLWGQTDSIYALFLLLAFFLLNQNKLILSTLLYGLAILTKPTALFALPIFLVWWLSKSNLKKTLLASALAFLELVIFYLPFHTENFFSWIINFYLMSLGGIVPALVINSFNFWGILTGLKIVSERVLFMGIPAFIVGNTIFFLTTGGLILYLLTYSKKLNLRIILLFSAFLSFTAFMFLPRMHERYLYPTLILLLPLVAVDKKIRWLCFTLAIIHFLNLYNFWYVPRIDFLVIYLSNSYTLLSLMILNFLLYLYLGWLCLFQKIKDELVS